MARPRTLALPRLRARWRIGRPGWGRRGRRGDAVRAAAEGAPAPGEVDLCGCHLWPTLVDPYAHLDKGHFVHRAPNWPGDFRPLRDAYAGRVALQAVGFVALDTDCTPFGARLADLVATTGGLVGGVIRSPAGLSADRIADLAGPLDRLFRLARERGHDVDFHVDESDDPTAAALPAVARAAMRHGYGGASPAAIAARWRSR